LRHVLREIKYDCHVAALAGEGGASATTEHGHAPFPASGEGGDYVVIAAGENDPDGDLAVVGSVGGVQGAAAGIEADLSRYLGAKGEFQSGNINVLR
jgi:hypothetical protein